MGVECDRQEQAPASIVRNFLGELQKDEPLYKVHRQINVPPCARPSWSRSYEQKIMCIQMR